MAKHRGGKRDLRRWTCPRCHDVFYSTAQLKPGGYIPRHSYIGEPGKCVAYDGTVKAVRDGYYKE